MSANRCETAPVLAPAERGTSAALQRAPLVIAAAVTLVTWAGAFVAVSVAARELSPAPFALARLGSAALVLLLAWPLIRGERLGLPRLRDLPGLAFMALLGFPVYHTALNAGQRVVDPGAARLLIATLPIFATIVARFAMRESLSARGWLGIVIGFVGVSLLVVGGNGDFQIQPHALLVLFAALAGAGFMVTQRHFTRRYSGFALTIWGIWLGAIMLTPFAPRLVEELSLASKDTLLAVAYLGVFPTALAYVTWAYVLKTLPAARATSLLFVVPPMAFLFAWLIIGTTPGWLDGVSGLIIIVGVAVVQRAEAQAAGRSPHLLSVRSRAAASRSRSCL
jgi:drug/metabolite transporter (DMT)-like permease